MPVVKEQDLLEMHQKIEKLETQNEQANQFYEQGLKKAKNENKQLKVATTVTSILAVVGVAGAGLVWFLMVYKAKPKEIIKEKIVEKIIKVPVKKPIGKPDFYYTLQVGAFKKLAIKSSPPIMLYTANGYNEYLMGVFTKYKDAKDFERGIEKLLGIKDCHVVAIKKEKKLPIENAVKLSKEENVFLSYRKK